MKFNEVTNKQIYSIIVKDENGIKRCITNIYGAVLVLSLPRDVYASAKVNDVYRGQINIVKRFMLEPIYVGKGTGIGIHGEVKNHGSKQSVRQHVDSYLVRIKRDMYSRGYKAGTDYWRDTLQAQVDLYNEINGTNWSVSKDSPQWFK